MPTENPPSKFLTAKQARARYGGVSNMPQGQEVAMKPAQQIIFQHSVAAEEKSSEPESPL